MATITIRHTHAGGTIIEGSAKGDGVWEVVKDLRWRYRPVPGIHIQQSRYKAAQAGRIQAAANALRAAGHDVTVEIDESERVSFAEQEADRAERAEARAGRYEERSERVGAQAQADYDRARELGSVIPFGQPMMPDHYSYNRDRNYRAKIGRTYDRAFEGMGQAEELARRAESAEATQAHRESVPTTLRRIEKLEAEERTWQRVLDGKPDSHTRRTPDGGYRPAEGTHRARVETELASVREQLAYWREHVAKREAEGVKVWTRDDFAKGDYVQFLGTWYAVLRVSAKSVTIPAMINTGPVVHATGNRCTWTDTVPYHKVKGRKSAEEMAAMLAESEQAAS
jgi:hypothetical protein